MLKSLFTAATGMKAQQLLVDNIANNLANANTTGFKKMMIDFADLFYDTQANSGAESTAGYQLPTGLQVGSGVRQVASSKVFTPGLPQETRREYDVMISGDGFFQITHPGLNDTVYTRDGSFRLNSQRQLVTSSGYFVEPQITAPNEPGKVSIGRDGTVTFVPNNDQNTPTAIGQLQLVSFPNPAGLENYGSNLYRQTAASGDPVTGTPGADGLGELHQGYLEMSNVDVVDELVRMIIAQRAYEINSRAIRTSDSMLEQANNVVR